MNKHPHITTVVTHWHHVLAALLKNQGLSGTELLFILVFQEVLLRCELHVYLY